MNPQPKENIMNLTYAIPAVITLTAHALIFIGSGGPPMPIKIAVQSVTTPANDPRELLLKPEPIPPADEDSIASDKSDVIAPVRTFEPPPINNPTRTEITQKYVAVETGSATSLTALNVGKPNRDGGGRKSLTIDMLDDMPRTRFQKAPSYPTSLKSGGVTGTVWVEFVVDERGVVNDVRVVKTTNSGFDEATRSAVSQWRFEPGKRKGIPVSFRMSIPIVFNLNE